MVRNSHDQHVSFFYRSLRRINFHDFQRDLEMLPWDNIMNIQNIDEKVDFFNDCMLGLIEAHAPLKQYRKKSNYNYAPWITDNIKLLQKLRNKALKRFKKTKLPEYYNYYKQLRNYTTAAIRANKKAYIRTKFRNCNVKEKWKELKKLDLTKKKQIDIPTKLSNVNEMNDYFVNSVKNDLLPKQELLNFYNKNRLQDINNLFTFSFITEYDVSKIILNIKTKAIGRDKINITIIQLCCPFVIPYITHIINECIRYSYFPALWKQAHVIPLPKVSNPTEYDQLRSISVLPTLSKVLERVLDGQIRIFLDHHNILPLKQSGFRAGYGCETALADITDDIIRASDQNKITILTLLDFSKAFNLLNHQLLLSILHYIGFSEDAVCLVQSFLSDRTQQVVLNEQYSDLLHISLGVPQGSILGPLLYTVYTFRFFSALRHCGSHFYADDTQIYFSFSINEIDAAQEIINSDLNSFYTIASEHLLKLNPEKSTVVVFGNDSQINIVKNRIKINLNNTSLSYSDHGKSLGLILDSKLRFREHVTAKLRAAYGNLKLIYTHRHCLPRDTRMLLCDTLVLSQFNHCSSVYVPCLDAVERYRIQKVQNSCLRLVYGVKRRNHISPFLRDSGWLNMYNRAFLHMANIYFKIIKSKSPPYLYQKLNFRTDVHNLNLRRRGVITVPQHRKEIFKRSFSYNIANTLNKLNCFDIDQSPATFKYRLKNHLLLAQN